jgi:hypothetical protein
MLLETIALVSTSITAGWIWSRVFITKQKAKFSSTKEELEALREVDQLLGIKRETPAKSVPIVRYSKDFLEHGCACPKCKLKLTCFQTPCCHGCSHLPDHSHFHLVCESTKGKGCRTKYLMLAADVARYVDPDQLMGLSIEEDKPEVKTEETV